MALLSAFISLRRDRLPRLLRWRFTSCQSNPLIAGWLAQTLKFKVAVRLHFITAGQTSSPASLAFYILSIQPLFAGWLARTLKFNVAVRLNFITAGQTSSPASLSFYILSIQPLFAGWLAQT